MKCTECHRPVRPVVAIDIDGTLGMFHSHFTKFARQYTGFGLAENNKAYPYDVEYNEWLGIEKGLYREIKLAYRQGGMKRNMPVYPNAAELPAMLHAAGAEIWIATTRPYMRLDNIDPDTRHWLERNRINYDHMIYGEDKWETLIDCVGLERIIAVVDDLPEEIDKAAKLGIPTMQKTDGHARSAKREPFHGNLQTIAQILRGRVVKWRQEHGDFDGE